jgi:hypothetical protein
MNYFRQGPSFLLARGAGPRFLIGCVLVSIGILLAGAGGSWDITNHLLNKPETFFAPPHAVLYSGAAIAVAGAAMVFTAARSAAGNRIIIIPWPAKMVAAGVIVLVAAGPADFAWHSAFGLDGLLSPPHFVLLSGMVASSIGALAGVVYYNKTFLRGSSSSGSELRLSPALIVIGILPIWLALSGVVDMFSLPFSETDYFNFNPPPALGAANATLGFPFLIAAMLYTASVLAGRRFGIMSITGAAFIATGVLTSIAPNEALVPTLPFYMLNMIPIVAADAILSYRYWRPFKISIYAAGAIAGLAFFTLYYPLITHTYNEVLTQEPALWASLTAPTYFEMIGTVLLFAAVPAAAMGVLGAVTADKLIAKNKIL